MGSVLEGHPDSADARDGLGFDLLEHHQRVFLLALGSVVNVVVCFSDRLFFVEPLFFGG